MKECKFKKEDYQNNYKGFCGIHPKIDCDGTIEEREMCPEWNGISK